MSSSLPVKVTVEFGPKSADAAFDAGDGASVTRAWRSVAKQLDLPPNALLLSPGSAGVRFADVESFEGTARLVADHAIRHDLSASDTIHLRLSVLSPSSTPTPAPARSVVPPPLPPPEKRADGLSTNAMDPPVVAKAAGETSWVGVLSEALEGKAPGSMARAAGAGALERCLAAFSDRKTECVRELYALHEFLNEKESEPIAPQSAAASFKLVFPRSAAALDALPAPQARILAAFLHLAHQMYLA